MFSARTGTKMYVSMYPFLANDIRISNQYNITFITNLKTMMMEFSEK